MTGGQLGVIVNTWQERWSLTRGFKNSSSLVTGSNARDSGRNLPSRYRPLFTYADEEHGLLYTTKVNSPPLRVFIFFLYSFNYLFIYALFVP